MRRMHSGVLWRPLSVSCPRNTTPSLSPPLTLTRWTPTVPCCLSGHSTLLSGHSTLLSGHSTLLSGYSTLLSGHSTLLSGYSTLLSGYSTLLSGHSTLLSGYSTLLSGCRWQVTVVDHVWVNEFLSQVVTEWESSYADIVIVHHYQYHLWWKLILMCQNVLKYHISENMFLVFQNVLK